MANKETNRTYDVQWKHDKGAGLVLFPFKNSDTFSKPTNGNRRNLWIFFIHIQLSHKKYVIAVNEKPS